MFKKLLHSTVIKLLCPSSKKFLNALSISAFSEEQDQIAQFVVYTSSSTNLLHSHLRTCNHCHSKPCYFLKNKLSFKPLSMGLRQGCAIFKQMEVRLNCQLLYIVKQTQILTINWQVFVATFHVSLASFPITSLDISPSHFSLSQYQRVLPSDFQYHSSRCLSCQHSF